MCVYIMRSVLILYCKISCATDSYGIREVLEPTGMFTVKGRESCGSLQLFGSLIFVDMNL